MNIRLMTKLFTACLALTLPQIAHAAGCMDTDPPHWLTDDSQRALYDRLVGYMSCPDNERDGRLADQIACNYFVGRALSDIHSVTDFQKVGGGWMVANEMFDLASKPNGAWKTVGRGNNQAALKKAADLAGGGTPVIAASRGVGVRPGHVALVLPGKLRTSGGWGLDVPNSAAFSLNNVDGAYVFCRLSYGFADSSSVTLFARTH